MARNKKGQWVKGSVPYNKGLKRGSVSPETEFKDGHVPHNFYGIGYEGIYVKRKEVNVTMDKSVPRKHKGKVYNIKTKITKARYVWQNHCGDIPKGYIIYNNGDWYDIHIDNLECISRAELLKRNRNLAQK